MSNVLRPPSLGPIVGHTTEKSVRVWIRGAEVGENRTVGVAALYLKQKYVAGSVQYFRLHREYDRTGCVDFEGLAPDTEYTVRTGSLTVDTTDALVSNGDDDVFKKLPKPNLLEGDLTLLPDEEAAARVRTFPAGKTKTLSFVFGSCRYPGVLWTKKRADVIFDSIYRRFTGEGGAANPRFFMMVGDQIYADVLPKDLGVSVADTEEEFRDRYLSAFGAPNTRRLLANVPTYMILDDHEIEDNWVQGRIRIGEKRRLFNMAIGAYLSYQWFHGPRNYVNKLYYSFVVGGFPFFVVDGRTQRVRDDDDQELDDNHLLGRPGKGGDYEGQIDVLCGWLRTQQKTLGDAPKFVVTASVFAPNSVESVDPGRKWKDDSWAAFPNTRRQLLKTITENKIQNVVFLSGDIHCSNVAEIGFFDAEGKATSLKAYSITSSAFYWPYPFSDGDPLGYVHDSHVEGDDFDIGNGYFMRYRARDFEQDDNFTQVDVDWQNRVIRTRTFDKKGKQLGASTLKLA